MSSPLLIRFGPFELDAAAGELRKSGMLLKLQPQPVRVLIMLAERPGKVVTREEIRARLWGDDTFVDFERSINFCINQIRGALGDDAERPRFVETLPRRGYRFIGQIRTDGEEATIHPAGAPEGTRTEVVSQGPLGRAASVASEVSRLPLFPSLQGRSGRGFWA